MSSSPDTQPPKQQTNEPRRAENADERNIFYRQDIYPDAAGLLSWVPASIVAVKEEAVVVVDTNALLVPYGTGKASLDEIGNRYRDLAAKGRLVIPGQVVREFAVNRTEKLKELHQQLTRKRTGFKLDRETYPLLEESADYRKLLEVEASMAQLIEQYKSQIEKVISDVKRWRWNDPVTMLYRLVFAANVVQDPSIQRDELEAERQRRIKLSIPPGYKDAQKEDGGVGDIIIWRTILEVAKSRECHMFFVSGDLKADWWCQSEGGPLYPRFELVDEYRRASGGKSLHLMTFSTFLELFGADKNVVEEVKKEEHDVRLHGRESVAAGQASTRLTTFHAVGRWLKRKFADVVVSEVAGIQFFAFGAGNRIAVRYAQVVAGSTPQMVLDMIHANMSRIHTSRFEDGLSTYQVMSLTGALLILVCNTYEEALRALGALALAETSLLDRVAVTVVNSAGELDDGAPFSP